MSNITEKILRIKGQIGKTELVAVSKTKPIEDIREALRAGQRVFGENKVQEASAKFPQLRVEYPDLKLHLIGPLQTNKVKDALQLFDVIQTLDREKLALAIAKETGNWKQETRSNFQLLASSFFIQVNIGEEPQKAGIAPQQTAEFFKFCTQDLKLPVAGLMCIPPINEPAFMYFALLKNIARDIEHGAWSMEHNEKFNLNAPTPNLQLSMGMSSDYMDAVELGADYIRVGSAIFGERFNLSDRVDYIL